MRFLLSLFLIVAASLHVFADAREPCRTSIAADMLERAAQAREDFFLWEDIDEGEATAELARYTARLESLRRYLAGCGSSEPGKAALQWRVDTSLAHAAEIALARRSAANRQVRSAR